MWGTQREGVRCSGLLGPDYELRWDDPKHDEAKNLRPYVPAAHPIAGRPGFALVPACDLGDPSSPGRDVLLLEKDGAGRRVRGFVHGFEAALDPALRGSGLGAEMFLAAAFWRSGAFGDSVSSWFSDAGAACAGAAHRLAVGRAAGQRLHVPKDVLADYPEIAAKVRERAENESRALDRLLGRT